MSLLAERRKQYGIPESAFRTQASFDRIYVWQVADYEGETYQGTSIITTQVAQARAKTETPRGIIVSAGLSAMDQLASHGMGVGDLVWIVRMAPWRMPIGFVNAQEKHLYVLRAGDVVGGEDTAKRIASGELTIVFDEESGQHVLKGKDGKVRRPVAPAISVEM